MHCLLFFGLPRAQAQSLSLKHRCFLKVVALSPIGFRVVLHDGLKFLGQNVVKNQRLQNTVPIFFLPTFPLLADSLLRIPLDHLIGTPSLAAD